MDKVMFEKHLAQRYSHQELTAGLEIYGYSDPQENNYTERFLLDHALEDFLHKTVQNPFGPSMMRYLRVLGLIGNNKYEPPACPEGVEHISTMRLILQKNVELANTFEPTNLSLPKEVYKMMVEIMHLPCSWIETSSFVGPLFWTTVTKIEGNPYFQMIYRKSDVKKDKKTRGWELVLSHDINGGITTGFYKGTESSKITECLKLLRECILDIGHPMLLPILICSRDLDMEGDLRQREARESVRVLEKTITEAAQIYTGPIVTKVDIKEDKIDLGLINKELVDCHCKVLWKRPEAYLDIVSSMQVALIDLQQLWPDSMKEQVSSQQSSLEARLRFLKVRLQGVSTYRQVTIARLEMLQGLVQNLVSLSIARTQKRMTIVRDQRRLTIQIEEMKEDDQKERRRRERQLQDELENQKSVSIALVGVFFLPGAFFAAIFSTTFFDFHAENPKAIISPWFWVYWIITVPVTLIILGLWYLWHLHIKAIKMKSTTAMEEGEEIERERIHLVRQQLHLAELSTT